MAAIKKVWLFACEKKMFVLLKEQYSVPSSEGNMHQKQALYFSFAMLLLLHSNQL